MYIANPFHPQCGANQDFPCSSLKKWAVSNLASQEINVGGGAMQGNFLSEMAITQVGEKLIFR
jgi:hypothetical protein